MRGQENTWPRTDPFASRGNVQRTPDGAAGPAQSDFSSGRGATHRNMSAVPGPDFLSSTGTHRNLSAVPGPDFLSSTGTHRNLSAVSHVGGRQGGGDTGCVVRTGAAPVVSSGQGGTGCVVRTGRHRLCRPDGAAPVVSSSFVTGGMYKSQSNSASAGVVPI